jgi:hypothetical protein
MSVSLSAWVNVVPRDAGTQSCCYQAQIVRSLLPRHHPKQMTLSSLRRRAEVVFRAVRPPPSRPVDGLSKHSPAIVDLYYSACMLSSSQRVTTAFVDHATVLSSRCQYVQGARMSDQPVVLAVATYPSKAEAEQDFKAVWA